MYSRRIQSQISRHHASSRITSIYSSPEVGAEAGSLSDLISVTKSYEEDALKSLADSSSSKEVEALRVAFLGKNGKITGMMKEMKRLTPVDKPKLGEVVNTAKTRVEEAIEKAKEDVIFKEKLSRIESESLGNTAQIPSLPMFGRLPGTRHPLNLVLDLTTKIFEEIGYEIISGPNDSPEIENDFYNFEALGMPQNHPARDMQDTFYINTTGLDTNETLLLRTHTSAVQIRELEKRKPPFKIVVPGRVYRKDDVDATHYPIFHQVRSDRFLTYL
jgi:phenylalanyl-tRNA synthetase alpha chain